MRKRIIKKRPPAPTGTTIPAAILAEMILDKIGAGRYRYGGGECRIRGRVDVVKLPESTTVRHTTQRGNPKRGNTPTGRRAHRMPYGPGKTW